MRTRVAFAVSALLVASAPAFAQATMNPDGRPVENGTGAAMQVLSKHHSGMGVYGTRSHNAAERHAARSSTTVGNIANQRINGG